MHGIAGIPISADTCAERQAALPLPQEAQDRLPSIDLTDITALVPGNFKLGAVRSIQYGKAGLSDAATWECELVIMRHIHDTHQRLQKLADLQALLPAGLHLNARHIGGDPDYDLVARQALRRRMDRGGATSVRQQLWRTTRDRLNKLGAAGRQLSTGRVSTVVREV